jgi:hypothetical protein
MSKDELQHKIEAFIDTTVLPAFSKVGEDLYKDGVKTKFTSKPWKKELKKNAFFHVFDLELSHGEKEFCKISSYLSIQGKNHIQFGSSIKKIYGTETRSELVIENIDKIDKNSLAEDILKKV